MPRHSTRRRILWSCAALVALAGGMLAWLVFDRLSPFDMWLLAQRSQAIAYAEFRAGTDGRYAYVKDIWKQARGPEQLAIGTPISMGAPFAGIQEPVIGVLLFFDGGSSREFRHLRGSSRLFLTDGRVRWGPGEMSLAEAKALCQRKLLFALAVRRLG
jgi:hypothetical protein